jgi:hypothetical protein
MSNSKVYKGMMAISQATGVKESTLLSWHREHAFPMTRHGEEWTLEASALEEWARGRLAAEQRRGA